MSLELTTWLKNKFTGDASITTLLGKDSSNNPAVFSYHYRSKDERVPYPHVTIARFGDRPEENKFQESEFATSVDNPRFAICVWSQKGVDELYRIYRLLDAYLRPSLANGIPNISNEYFGTYKIKRTTLRDDLFDDKAKAYHLHSEYSCYLMLTGTPQP